MRPQRSAVVLGVMIAALLVWLVVRSRVAPPSPRPATVETPAPAPAPAPKAVAASIPSPPDLPTPQIQASPPTSRDQSTPTPSANPSVQPSASIPAAAPVLASSESASVNVIKVRRMITDFHTLTGENPIGTNAEIMAAVMGKNPRQAIVGPPDGLGLNANGELVDEWGTPYFFHQLSRDVMEIHSAGADKVMGTADDVIAR